MQIDLQYRINQDKQQKQFLRENSYWYKYLNRSNEYYKDFINDMKNKYKLNPTDKMKKMIDDINMIQNLLNILK